LSKKHTEDESAPGAPAWTVTFSDMITLLLTFFVLLLSLGSTKDAGIVDKGRGDAFVKSLKGHGRGFGQGKKIKSKLNHEQSYYGTDMKDDSSSERLLDAEEEKVRRLFKEVSKSMKAIPSQITSDETAFSPTNIKFADNSDKLDINPADLFNELCSSLKQNQSDDIKLCIVGLANDTKDEKQRWILSAKRAQIVSDLLKKTLKEQKLDYPVYSWGAGDGGEWTNTDSAFSKELQVLITILRTGD